MRDRKSSKFGVAGQERNPRLAFAVGVVLAAAAGSAAAEPATAALEDVVVTATRRTQNVVDVPYNISAVSGHDIESAGVTDLQGLERVVPGLLIPDLGQRGNSMNGNIVLRGLNTSDLAGGGYIPSATVPAVSTYVDDIAMFTNLNLDDIGRVEVLRGPQGTLYGSGSVAGTIRLIHNRPDPTQFAASVNAEVASPSHAEGTTGRVSGLVNMPLGADVALRLSAGHDYIAGFVGAPNAAVLQNGQPVLANPADPVNSGLTFHPVATVDSGTSTYARAALLWNISSTANVLLSFQHQDDDSNGNSVDTPGHPYQRLALYPAESLRRSVNLGSMTLTDDFGFASVTSATAFYSNHSVSTTDVTPALLAIDAGTLLYGGYPRLTGPIVNGTRESAFSEELRLVSKTGGEWDYIVGAFFRHEYDAIDQIQYIPGFAAWSELTGSAGNLNAAYGTNAASYADFLQTYLGGPRPSTITPTDAVFFYNRTSSFLDRAVYGELTRHITPAWQITAGARMFWQAYQQDLTESVPLCGTACSTLPVPDSYGSSVGSASRTFRDHIFKLNTSYALTPSSNLYATWAQGFRHGGANAVPVGTNCASCDSAAVVPYGSDRATNYEVGFKGETPDRRFRYVADLYRVDWQDVQINTLGAIFEPLVVNGGSARSQGVELEFAGRLTSAFSMSFGYTYADPKFTSDKIVYNQGAVPIALNAVSGAPLPYASKNTMTVSLDYHQGLGASRSLELHGDWNTHTSQTTADLTGAGGFHIGGYSTGNVSATVHWNDHLSTRLFINNVSDGHHVTVIVRGYDAAQYDSNYLARPRTVGLNVGYTF